MIKAIGEYQVISCDEEGCEEVKRNPLYLKKEPSRNTSHQVRNSAKNWIFTKDKRQFCPQHFPSEPVEFTRKRR